MTRFQTESDSWKAYASATRPTARIYNKGQMLRNPLATISLTELTRDGRKPEQNGAIDKLWGLSVKQLTGEVDDVASGARSSTIWT